MQGIKTIRQANGPGLIVPFDGNFFFHQTDLNHLHGPLEDDEGLASIAAMTITLEDFMARYCPDAIQRYGEGGTTYSTPGNMDVRWYVRSLQSDEALSPGLQLRLRCPDPQPDRLLVFGGYSHHSRVAYLLGWLDEASFQRHGPMISSRLDAFHPMQQLGYVARGRRR